MQRCGNVGTRGTFQFFKGEGNQGLCLVLLPLVGMQKDESSELSLSDISHVFLLAVLKLLKMATGMRALLDTVVQALPQVKPTSFPQDSLSAPFFFFPKRSILLVSQR